MDEEMELIFKYVRLPDFATLLNALFGMAAISLLVLDKSYVLQASIYILLGAMMDGLDGLLARKIEYGVFGTNLDSFADLITFGLAPAAICYALMPGVLLAIFSAFFLIAGMLRLARFNILPKSEDFIGMPITAAGVTLVLFVLAFASTEYFALVVILLLLLSCLMVSRIPYPKIRDRKLLVIVGSLLLLAIAAFYLNIKALDTSAAVLLSYILLALMALYIMIPPARRALHKKQ